MTTLGAKAWLCAAAALVLAGCGDSPDSPDSPGGDAAMLPVVERPQAPGSAPTPSDGVAASVTPVISPTSTATATAPATPTPNPTSPSTAEPGGTHGPADPPTERPSERDLLEAEVVELTNAERAAADCPAVHVDERLVAAARGHSEDMAERDFVDHTNPDGQTPWDRARAAGYDWAASENIAWGYPTAEAVVAGWMDSPGHRRNILDCDVVAVGVGVADSPRGLYWTQMFGRR